MDSFLRIDNIELLKNIFKEDLRPFGKISKDIIPYVFVPTLITLSLALLSGLAIFITSKKFNKKTMKLPGSRKAN